MDSGWLGAGTGQILRQGLIHLPGVILRVFLKIKGTVGWHGEFLTGWGTFGKRGFYDCVWLN